MMRPIAFSRTVFVATLALASTAAHAQRRRVSLGVELGGGTLLHDFDHDGLNASTPALWSAARVHLALWGPVSLQAGFTYGRFFRPRRPLPVVGGTLGLRVAPPLGRRARLWVDVEGGAFAPGSVVRPGLTAGLGAEFDVTPAISLGPFARFTQIWDGRAGVGTLDATYTPSANAETADLHGWTAGITLSLHLPARPVAPRPSQGSAP